MQGASVVQLMQCIPIIILPYTDHFPVSHWLRGVVSGSDDSIFEEGEEQGTRVILHASHTSTHCSATSRSFFCRQTTTSASTSSISDCFFSMISC